MAGISGKAALLKFCATLGGSYVTIADLNNVTFTIDNEALDITAFAATYGSKVAGLKNWSISASGFRNTSDTTGQNAIHTAVLGDTDTFLQILPNGTTGYKGQVIINSLETGDDVGGVVSFSLQATGTGALTAV